MKLSIAPQRRLALVIFIIASSAACVAAPADKEGPIGTYSAPEPIQTTSPSGSSPNPLIDAASEPVLQWDFDGEKDVILDRSGNGNFGAVVQPTRLSGGPGGGHMLVVDGTSDSTPRGSVELRNGDALGFSVWVRLRASERTRIFEYTDREGFIESVLELARSEDGEVLTWSVGSALTTARANLSNGEWHHIAGSWSRHGSNMSIWVDGREVFADLVSGQPSIAVSGVVRLGAETANEQRSLASARCADAGSCTETRSGAVGAFDDFALFDRTLTDDDIRRVFVERKLSCDESYGTFRCPASSCAQVLETKSGWGDGVYWLWKSDGPVQTVCAMRDGGVEGKILRLRAIDDAHADSQNPSDQHYGVDLRVAKKLAEDGEPEKENIAFMRFDLSNVEASEIISARLEFTPFVDDPAQMQPSGYDSALVQNAGVTTVHAAGTTWSQSSLSWDDRPALDEDFIGVWGRAFHEPEAAQRVRIATAALRDLVERSVPEGLLAVGLVAEEQDYFIYSKETAPEGEQPELVLAVMP